MGFREDLSLPHLEDYTWVFDEFGGEEGEDNTGLLPDAPIRRDGTAPWRVGNGPTVASTCTALARLYPADHAWDPNGWYVSLGVSHRVSRKALRNAYLALEGSADERMTFALHMLLDPDVRQEYDLLPLGHYYLDDPHYQKWIKEQAIARAAERGMTVKNVLKEWGLDNTPPIELPEDSHLLLLDDTEVIRDNYVSETGWVYSWYAWRVDESQAHKAEALQREIVSFCSEVGLVLNLTVGVMKSPFPFRVQEVDGTLVVFIAQDANPQQHASAMVHELLTTPKTP